MNVSDIKIQVEAGFNEINSFFILSGQFIVQLEDYLV